MDRVGFEPTTSAGFLKKQPYRLSREAAPLERNITVQIPPSPP
jgi:hypothetical protein